VRSGKQQGERGTREGIGRPAPDRGIYFFFGGNVMHRSPTYDPGRRQFLARASATGIAALAGLDHLVARAETPPEISKIRIVHAPAVCFAPQYLAEELLRLEGFTEVEYLALGTRGGPDALADGRADVTMWPAAEFIPHLDAGRPIVLLAGIHGGCWELFGNERVRSIPDLKGKTVSVTYLGDGQHVLLSAMLAYVGIHPREVRWLEANKFQRDAMALFVEGKADAFFGFPPQPQELRARRVGHAIVKTAEDKPWNQYFCCMFAVNRDFAQRNPVATKCALRAVLKATDICASEPQRVARYLADHQYETRFDLSIDALKTVNYRMWRDANPEDTMRFYALRLHEVGMIKSSPQKLIAQGTDWRFLNELKKELKA
jgi:NitT/TauT family transport system substrate-binding protein